MSGKFQSTKTYGHEVGLSCAFRQWRAQSHCRLLHGYAMSFKFTFECVDLDARNWCVDFGGLKGIRAMLEDTFDHSTIVAEDDPELEWFVQAHAKGILRMVMVPAGGCEKFAQMVYEAAAQWLIDAGFAPRCRLVSVEVSEHGANSASYHGD